MKTNVCGIVSLILSIAAIVTSCIYIISISFAIIALTLGIIGVALPYEKKETAVAGITCSILSILSTIGAYNAISYLNDMISETQETFQNMF